MILVGLTGGIGSGKSAVADLLAARGAAVVDADVVARRVVEPGRPAHRLIVERFGPGVVGPDGALDRSALAAPVFADPAARADLEAITHPRIAAEMADEIAGHAGRAGAGRIVVAVIPLLVESADRWAGLAGVVVVDCPVAVVLDRLTRRGMDPAHARARMAAQAGREARLARADFVIDNGGDRRQLASEVARCWDWLQGIAAAPDL